MYPLVPVIDEAEENECLVGDGENIIKLFEVFLSTPPVVAANNWVGECVEEN